ncbi:uncharacterized protein Dwil_GK28118 [Drosophila willistoni]|uniref:C2H2-type domain-containing protein n=1 Tax=Drosophila willistoni TaxID=7260 RepID=A0A0Q9X005_DROWI|nr:zinc finger protein 250-like [Drosophila willistoni]KRF98294.1 uncharacterized protein Dwil_GK28118 [Drosophila willistoni]
MSRSCNTCGKEFSKPALLKRHQVVHTKEKLFSCEKCSCSFSQRSSLQRHHLRKHAKTLAKETKSDALGQEVEEDAEGEVAQQTLVALINLQSHMETAQQSQSIATLEEQPMVSRLVDIKDNLHPNRSERVLLKTQLIQRSLTGQRCYYVCEFCAKEFSKTYDLIRHRRIHTKEKPYACTENECFKLFSTKAKLREHQKALHCPHQKPEVKKLPKRDKTLENLKLLLPQPPILGSSFKCVYCQKIFSRKFNCRIHMLTHLKRLLNANPEIDSQIISHICSHCGKSFMKSHDLSRHMLIHSKIKSHSCHICLKTYILKSTLTRHLLTHKTDQISFNCQVCGKSFKSRTSLNLHLRLHTGERPFSCEICHETFRTSGHRLEHMRGQRHRISKIDL